MRRVVILGPPGSGKSTLARRIGERHGLPVFHLDRAFWGPGWVERPTDAFRAEVARIADLPAWVADGNYTGTLAPRFAAADTAILIEVPAWLSVLRILRRLMSGYGRVRPDSAEDCPERLDAGFLRFAWRWNRVSRGRMRDLVAAFPGRRITLATAKDRSRFFADPR